jgi:BASS family bile acid:Na+ symporter
MVATGMSLDRAQFIANWRQLTPGMWARLLVATFVVTPVLALALGHTLPIGAPATAGLFLVAVAPGAPLMTRNVAQRGFDMQLAAGYQVWGALLAPVMIPLLVGGAGWLHEREIWISPLRVLAVIAKQQFAPLLAGMLLRHFAPSFCENVRRPLNVIGNLTLIVAIVWLLWRLGPALATVSPWLALAVLALAAGCLVIMRFLIPAIPTLALSNVNRHAGLALLLSASAVQNAQRALPVIAAYALSAPLVMILYVRFIHQPAPAAS